MKIMLYVNSHLPSIGGRELVVHHLATQFQALGLEVVVAGAAGWRAHRQVQFEYPVVRWPLVPGFKDLSRQTALRLYLSRKSFDIIHAHSTYPCAYNAARLGRLIPPLVVTPHGEDINVVPEIGFGQRLDPEQAKKIEFAVRQAVAATAISETVFQSLCEVGVPEEKVVRIRNGVDVERFSLDPDVDVRRHFGLPQNSKIVTSIGNYHPRKGHETLIEAVAAARKLAPEIVLLLVGRTSEALCRQVESKGYDQFVKFAGTLGVPMPNDSNPDVLAALLKASRAYVSASIDEGAEGLSLALLEGMAAGACPIVTRISGNRDIIRDNENGVLVSPGNVEEMKEALVAAVRNPERIERLIEGAKATVRSYSWRAVAEDYVSVYEAILGAKPLPGRLVQ